MSTENKEHQNPSDNLTKDVLKEISHTPTICRNTWFAPFQVNQVEGRPSSVTLGAEGNQPPPGVEIQASNLPITTLGSGPGDNTLSLTYGQISSLAGDFYGTSDPISDGSNDEERRRRFMSALNTLINNPQDQPKDARNLLEYLQKEIDAVKNAVAKGLDPSTVYKGGEVVDNGWLQYLTLGRKYPKFISYAGLAVINWDHFGDDARVVYKTGHLAAIKHAASSTSKDALFQAYSMNAFADHFLQDLFSAGHLRTPRRQLHGHFTVTDKCAQYMHDEDCALGLQVTNEDNHSWTVYGDRRLLDKVNNENLIKCLDAVQTSAQEVYQAWKNQTVLNPDDFGAWRKVPTKASALSTKQPLAPLFLLGPSGTFADLQRRDDLNDRRTWKYITNWTVAGTLIKLTGNKRWKYPMQM
ncbi:uncharacterized protein PGRI_019890 [Penicillium griseofulvum]|uniref:Phosphatidylcholine-hydrolyzing phospholipase C n=1 Tax=Penicillium patulum TaxID=5078 RepID=A0A135LGN4_PENPA|nr:uncharacterized protein PGRI_019890 [Penicillium griseofulvum]KXG48119.1 hypothetical protein PGRI_019890 [Penicillium griseofulvum]